MKIAPPKYLGQDQTIQWYKLTELFEVARRIYKEIPREITRETAENSPLGTLFRRRMTAKSRYKIHVEFVEKLGHVRNYLTSEINPMQFLGRNLRPVGAIQQNTPLEAIEVNVEIGNHFLLLIRRGITNIPYSSGMVVEIGNRQFPSSKIFAGI